MGGLRISQVASQADVNLETIRYYERQGLLPKPPRTGANYRAYPADTVQRVLFVKQAQALGFTLKEIKELLSLRATPRTRCEDVRRRAEGKIQDIDEKLHALQAMRESLKTLVRECVGAAPVTDCPILAAFDAREGMTPKTRRQ